MKLPSFIPKATKISQEDMEKTTFDDRILKLDVPFIVFALIGACIVVLALMMSDDSDSETIPTAKLILGGTFFGLIVIFFAVKFISDNMVVIVDGKPTDIMSRDGGNVIGTFVFFAILIFLWFFGLFLKERGNNSGIHAFFAYVLVFILRQLFRCTVKPLGTFIAIWIRYKRCSQQVPSKLFREVALFEADVSGKEEIVVSIPIYSYCCDDQYYTVMIRDREYLSDLGDEQPEFYADPKHPDRFFLYSYFKVDKLQAWNAMRSLLWIALFTSPYIIAFIKHILK